VAALGEPSGGKAVSNSLRVLMFPDVNRLPAALTQLGIGALVPSNRLLELFLPPFRVGFWIRPVFRTGMSEAAIHEHGYPKTDQHDIGSTWQVSPVQTEANSSSMQGGANCHLWPGVSGSLGGHEPADSLRRNYKNPIVRDRHGDS
jgi:hypothetical protein